MAQIFYDSHAHLNDEAFEGNLPAVIERCEEAGVTRIVNVGIDQQSSVRALEQAHEHDRLAATVGLNPHDAKDFRPGLIDFFDSLAADPRVVAVGETGLERHYNHSPWEAQVESFIAHLELADRVQLPVVIHCRDAYPELAEVLREHDHEGRAPRLVHCFNGTAGELAPLAELGCYFSLGGIVTFRNFDGTEAVRAIPADRLLLETDSPYLAPVPRRGRRNDPSLIVHTAAKVAEIRGVSLEELSRVTCASFEELFSAWPAG